MRKRQQAADAASDDTAARCARRCVEIIASLLRPEEIGEAEREFTGAISEELAFQRQKEEQCPGSNGKP